MNGRSLIRRNNPDPDSLTHFVDRMFNGDPFLGAWPNAELHGWNPAVDVHEEEDGFVFSADLPGMKREDVEVTIEDNILTVSGERRFEDSGEKNAFRRIERSYGRFSRHFSLPSHVDAGKVEAKFTDGVLTIRVPKTEAAKARKISIE